MCGAGPGSFEPRCAVLRQGAGGKGGNRSQACMSLRGWPCMWPTWGLRAKKLKKLEGVTTRQAQRPTPAVREASLKTRRQDPWRRHSTAKTFDGQDCTCLRWRPALVRETIATVLIYSIPFSVDSQQSCMCLVHSFTMYDCPVYIGMATFVYIEVDHAKNYHCQWQYL